MTLKNIEVRCLTCSLTFVTAQDSYESGEAVCPACRHGDLVTRIGTDELGGES